MRGESGLCGTWVVLLLAAGMDMEAHLSPFGDTKGQGNAVCLLVCLFVSDRVSLCPGWPGQ